MKISIITKNPSHLIPVIAIYLSIVPQFSYAQGRFSRGSALEYNYVNRQSNSEETLRLAILDFKKTGGEARYNVLERSLSEIIAVGLIWHEGIQYVDRGEFWRVAMQKYSTEQIRRSPEKLFATWVLDSLGIDLVLRGSFFEYRGKIRLEANLEKRESHDFVSITSDIVDVRDLLGGLEQFTKKLNAELLALRPQKQAKNLLVLCFNDKSSQRSGLGISLGQDIAISLISYLHFNEDITVLPWSQTEAFCGETFSSDQELLQKVDADVLLKGEYSLKADSLTVSPVLYIKDNEPPIELTKITGNLNDYFHFENSLIQEVTNVLEAILPDKGKWNIEQIRYTSNDPKNYFKKGKEYFEQKQNDYLAAWMFEKAVKLDPHFEQAYYYLGKVRSRQHRYTHALNAFQKAIEINATYAEAYNGLGNLYIQQGKYQSALEALEKTLQLRPEMLETHYNIAQAYYYFGDYDSTIQQSQKAINNKFQNPEIYNLLGRAYFAKDSVEKATEVFSLVLELDSNNEEARKALSSIYYQQGEKLAFANKYDLAYEELLKATQLNPNAYFYEWLGYVLDQLDKYEESRATIDEAIKLGYKNADIYHRQGINHQRLERYEEAISYYERALALKPRTADYYGHLGHCYFKLGDLHKSDLNYQIAIELDPDEATYYLDWAEVKIMRAQADSALSLMHRILASEDMSDTLDEQDKAIAYYLLAIAEKILNKDVSETEQRLQSILDTKDLQLNWSFVTFKSWLETANLDERTRTFIQGKTRLMEQEKGFSSNE